MEIQAKVRYINDEWRGRDDIPSISTRETRHANTSEFDVVIKDARDLGASDLDVEGFVLVDFPADIDFHDAASVQRSREGIVAPFLIDLTGAQTVFVTSHILRTEDQSSFINAYARFLHVDYPVHDDQIIEQQVLDQNGFKTPISEFDYAWFNLWTPFDHEVKQNALTVVDASSCVGDQYLDYYFSDSTRSVAAVPTYSNKHRFNYFSNMKPGEALVFKQRDSRHGKAKMCPHTAFYDPSVSDAPGRRSAEFRALCLFSRL